MNVGLKLVFSKENKPYLLDITSLLYDFELLHDFSLILWADDYLDYKFSNFMYRNGSPGEIRTLVSGARARYAWPLHHRANLQKNLTIY